MTPGGGDEWMLSICFTCAPLCTFECHQDMPTHRLRKALNLMPATTRTALPLPVQGYAAATYKTANQKDVGGGGGGIQGGGGEFSATTRRPAEKKRRFWVRGPYPAPRWACTCPQPPTAGSGFSHSVLPLPAGAVPRQCGSQREVGLTGSLSLSSYGSL
jgi:hypothetical protein